LTIYFVSKKLIEIKIW